MAGLRRIGPNPLCIGLPEEILGFEILVRLSSEDLVRCRAVCRSWRRLASTRDFLLAHHCHQPSLPLVLLGKHEGTWGDLRAFHHRAANGEVRLQPVARINDSTAITVAASCDGLLLLFVCTFPPYIRRDFICNPTTRQIGQVPEIHDFKVRGIYRHPPTGEYRLLLHMTATGVFCENDPCYVFALGCNQLQPRCIGCPPELAGFFDAPVVVRDNLHWSWWPYTLSKDHSSKMITNKDQSGKMITVFDTTAESFRLMLCPDAQINTAYLYEVDGTLGVYSCNYSMTTVDIWVMQDYDSEVWSHKYHVKLPVAEVEEFESREVMVLHDEGCVLSSTIVTKRCFLLTLRGNCLQVRSWVQVSA